MYVHSCKIKVSRIFSYVRRLCDSSSFRNFIEKCFRFYSCPSRNLSTMIIPQVLIISFPDEDWYVTCISVTQYSLFFMWDTWVILINTWIRYSSDTSISFRWICRLSDFVNRINFSSPKWYHDMSKWSRENLQMYFPRTVTVLYQINISGRFLSTWHWVNYRYTWEDILTDSLRLTRMDVTDRNEKTRRRLSNIYIYIYIYI